MTSQGKEPALVPINYLTSKAKPSIGEDHMYDLSKEPKSDFSYLKGL
jgi:hypothetical protein